MATRSDLIRWLVRELHVCVPGEPPRIKGFINLNKDKYASAVAARVPF